MELIFEWEANKAKANLLKQNVSFDEARTIFHDEALITFADDFHSHDEDRFISIGVSSMSRMLLVVHTEVDSTAGKITIRIISSRKATREEIKIYEQQK